MTIHIGSGTETATAFRLEGTNFHDDYYKEEVNCRVVKSIDYLTENHVDCVDFLKVDVEGMDLRVIKGFEGLIANVKVIQFEYGIFNIASHDLLYDFWRYLNQHDFIIGKIYPNCVNYFEYSFYHENFYGGNYLAVKKSEAELIKALSRKDRRRNRVTG